jgi:hypothetical protein
MTGMCWCDGPQGHVPAPPGSPYGSPPVKLGRMLGDGCKPKEDKAGKKLVRLPWGCLGAAWGCGRWCCG